MSEPLNFVGKWRLRNGYEAEVVDWTDATGWRGKITVTGLPITHNWNRHGNSEITDLDLMERLGWRARI